MTYVTWQRQDDVTYAKMCLPSLVTDTMRRFLRLESSKQLQGKNARGVVPLGVRGIRKVVSDSVFCRNDNVVNSLFRAIVLPHKTENQGWFPPWFSVGKLPSKSGPSHEKKSRRISDVKSSGTMNFYVFITSHRTSNGLSRAKQTKFECL